MASNKRLLIFPDREVNELGIFHQRSLRIGNSNTINSSRMDIRNHKVVAPPSTTVFESRHDLGGGTSNIQKDIYEETNSRG